MRARGVIRPGGRGIKGYSNSGCPHLPRKSMLAFLTHQVIRPAIRSPTGRTAWPQSGADLRKRSGSPLSPRARWYREGRMPRQDKGEWVQTLTTQCMPHPKQLLQHQLGVVWKHLGLSPELLKQTLHLDMIWGWKSCWHYFQNLWNGDTCPRLPSSAEGMLRKENEMHWSARAFKRWCIWRC